MDGSDSSLGLVRYLCAFSPDGVRHVMLNLEALVQSHIQAGVSSEVDLGPFFFSFLILIHLAVRGLSCSAWLQIFSSMWDDQVPCPKVEP